MGLQFKWKRIPCYRPDQAAWSLRYVPTNSNVAMICEVDGIGMPVFELMVGFQYARIRYARWEFVGNYPTARSARREAYRRARDWLLADAVERLKT
jgi:hypothetical protein